ncbi:MAG: polyisoprenoid-binding protein, partial [Verrucomicrobiota bacterium]|nr:polyisoprenoid-binding protein [Verrucomicrobiota bacterium]
MKTLLALFTSFVFVAAASAAVETYNIDPVHSSVNFSIRHFFSNVPGSFAKVHGTINVDRDDLTKSYVEATIDIASLTTNNGMRDRDVLSKKYFDASQFPTATFKSTSWTKSGADAYDVTGDLTIKGITKSVVLHVKSLGFG